ncbi:GNAT family N-acetyltransferase [Amnibacterium sp. CER49]|uniref:GNAT family N-acetyltransferase n=1 Tax=Amnibacterium sp. CER49 TaxID=3039161 RepID=UPI0024479128|nr:GNAT family N-acetyltransferase [Amnibacterium sp. CER49]MDH2444917.1 GNAT family N-acetyltransferase [Amnibacterium sp. CER49]
MTVRPATVDDAAALADLAAATFPLACPPSVTPEAIAAFVAANLTEERFAAYAVDPDRVLVVDDIDGRLDGYALLVHGEPADPEVAAAVPVRPTAELSKLYVRPAGHGTGVAGALLAAVLDAARPVAAGVWLGTNQANARALRFYEKHGFARVGTRRFLVGGALESDFVLHLPLS